MRGLSKEYSGVRAVDDLTFDVPAGRVTGFLGPNGAGKSTTMRMVVGLDRPTSGTATVNGRRYAELAAPLHEVGALLDAAAVHPGRTGRAHLRIAARTHGIPVPRVEEVLDQVGLTSAAGRRVKGYSLGMRQRLGIAAALLGDPPVMLFDEPVNGLDLDGVRWVRSLVRGFADQGRAVLVSSHLMSEVQLVADRVVVIGRGRLIAEADVDEVLQRTGGPRVLVETPDHERLGAALAERATVERPAPGLLEVAGLTASDIGDAAHALGVRLHLLAEAEHSLEQAYLSLTEDSVVHHGHLAGRPAADAGAATGGGR